MIVPRQNERKHPRPMITKVDTRPERDCPFLAVVAYDTHGRSFSILGREELAVPGEVGEDEGCDTARGVFGPLE